MKTTDAQNALKATLQKIIQNAFSVSDCAVQIVPPTDRTKADLVTNVAFVIAKEVKTSPLVVAQKIVEQYMQTEADSSEYFQLEACAPGFINIQVTDAFLTYITEDVRTRKELYGNNTTLLNQTVAIEHTSPNPNKAMHIGHLRNNLIGMSLVAIYKACGADVISEAVDNDRGISIAKAMWGFLISKKQDGQRIEDVSYWVAHQDEWHTPDTVNMKSDFFVDECYAIGSNDAKENKDAEMKVRQMVVDWEAKDESVWKLWELILHYAHEGMNTTLERVGNHWDMVWHEHEHYQLGKELVMEGVSKGYFTPLEDGAVLTGLEEKYGLPETILLKSDGTSLYITQDIALTKLKKEKHNADTLIWVTGSEQTMAMKQVFACCDQLGIGTLDSFTHIPYGLVTLRDADGGIKKMSSRDGSVVHIDALIDQTKNSLMALDREYDDVLVEKIAIGAIKYSLLRASRTTNILLNLEETISLSGDSGVYVMYTHSRIDSLLNKYVGNDVITLEAGTMKYSAHEKTVLLDALYFSDVIESALKDNSPNAIAEHLLVMAHNFNTFYADEKIISEDQSTTARKICVSAVAKQVMSNAFALLNIDIPERI